MRKGWGVERLRAHDANRRQLEIWKRTMDYEIRMMAPQSILACDEFLDRLQRFERELEAKKQPMTVMMMDSRNHRK